MPIFLGVFTNFNDCRLERKRDIFIIRGVFQVILTLFVLNTHLGGFYPSWWWRVDWVVAANGLLVGRTIRIVIK